MDTDKNILIRESRKLCNTIDEALAKVGSEYINKIPEKFYIEIDGDLLDQPGIICHQCNTCSTIEESYSGLAKTMFTKFPHANVYADGCEKTLGTVILRDNVANLIAQKFGGKPSPPRVGDRDSKKDREVYFASCLNELLSIAQGKVVSFPRFIGCNIAGGDWPTYKEIIDDFARDHDNDVFIVTYKS